MRATFLFFAALAAINVSAAQPPKPSNGTYYRLFAPLTFFHSVAGSQLSVGDEDDNSDETAAAINKALMDVYLERPDLVEVTETEQQQSGEIRHDVMKKPIEQHVALVEEGEPLPEAPEAENVKLNVVKPNFWKYKGDGYLQFMQNYVSANWYKGGESNQSAVGSLTLEANYDNKQKWKWENKLEMKLGFQTSRSDSVHRFKANEDLIRYTGKIGLQAANKWYYTLQMLAYTQFTHSFKSNDVKTYSDFMSPFNLSVGLGMDYKLSWLKGQLTGTVNISPLAMNYRYVGREVFDGSTWFPSRYGIEQDKHHLTDFGSQFTASLEWKLLDNLRWKARLYAFTSYKRTEIEWENTFSFQVSKYISANLFLFPRFDDSNKRDDDLGYWQFKQYSSVGFSYNF